MQATVYAQQLFLVNSDLIPAALFSMNFPPSNAGLYSMLFSESKQEIENRLQCAASVINDHHRPHVLYQCSMEVRYY